MNIIGLIGKARSGKSTAAEMITAQHLVRRHGVWAPIRTTENPIEVRGVELALADPMKVFLSDVYGWSDWVMWGPSEARESSAPDFAGLTARHALQQLGTEFGRGMHEDTWVKLLLRNAASLSETPRVRQLQVSHGTASHVVETCSLFVVSDVRFQNEVDAIRDAGGVIWQVVRSGAGLNGAAGQHTSETAQLEPDVVIQNEKSIDHLRGTLTGLVQDYLRRGGTPEQTSSLSGTPAPAMPF